MSIWESDTWQWWLQHGFDGIGAGVVGGLVTWLAVRATIRHENKHRDLATADAAIDNLRRHVLDLGDAFRRQRRLPDEDWEALFDSMVDVQESGWLVAFLATSRHPKLAEDMSAFFAATEEAFDEHGEIDVPVLNALRSEQWGRCMTWVADPAKHETLEPVDWPKIIAEARAKDLQRSTVVD